MDQGVFEMVEIGSLVPQNHLLRKIDAAVDFNHLYEKEYFDPFTGEPVKKGK